MRTCCYWYSVFFLSFTAWPLIYDHPLTHSLVAHSQDTITRGVLLFIAHPRSFIAGVDQSLSICSFVLALGRSNDQSREHGTPGSAEHSQSRKARDGIASQC